MPNWFLELSNGWDIEFGSSELEALGDNYESLPAAWADASDQARLWLCARFADTQDARLWCLGTAAACSLQILGLNTQAEAGQPGAIGSAPALHVLRDVLEPLQRGELRLLPGLTEAADAMIHYYEVPRLLLTAFQISQKIEAATVKAVAQIQRAGREPELGEVDARMLVQRSRFARTLVEAYRSSQSAMSNWWMSRGGPFTRWGTDRVQLRHRCTPDGRSIEAVR